MSQILSNSQITITASRAENGDKGYFSHHSDRTLELQEKNLRQGKDPLLGSRTALTDVTAMGKPKNMLHNSKLPMVYSKAGRPRNLS